MESILFTLSAAFLNDDGDYSLRLKRVLFSYLQGFVMDYRICLDVCTEWCMEMSDGVLLLRPTLLSATKEP